MMEPLTTAAIAVGSVIATKALEKTGEKVGEALWDKTGKFLVTLQKQSPHTVAAIEKAPEQPLDYGNAVLNVEASARTNPELAQVMQELAEVASSAPIPNLTKVLQDIASSLKSQSSSNQISIDKIDKIVNFAQGNISIKEQNVTI